MGKSLKSQRIQYAYMAISKLSDTTMERNNIINNYYSNKIKIMNKQLKLKKRSVLAKEKIAKAMTIIAGIVESSDDDDSSDDDSSDDDNIPTAK